MIKIISEFEEYLIADGKSVKTIESYVGDIRAFLTWFATKGNIFTRSLKRFHIVE